MPYHRVLLEFRPSNAAQSPATGLIAAVLAEYDAVAGRPLSGGPSATAQDFSPPGGTYLVGFLDEVPACGGGVKTLAAGIAEIKRMFVVLPLRGRGFGRALLKALEDVAEQRGHHTVRLDSDRATWPFYVNAGYCEIPDYNGNPDAHVWGEKRLHPDGRAQESTCHLQRAPLTE